MIRRRHLGARPIVLIDVNLLQRVHRHLIRRRSPLLLLLDHLAPKGHLAPFLGCFRHDFFLVRLGIVLMRRNRIFNLLEKVHQFRLETVVLVLHFEWTELPLLIIL